MSTHILKRIENVLDKQFSTHLDMSDWDTAPPDNRRGAFYSRAVAALCIKNLAHTDPETASKAVTDGFGDNGLDAIYFDQATDTLFLVQTKWSAAGRNPMDSEGCGAFVVGVRDLLSAQFDRFNDRIRSKEAEITAALYSERPITLSLVMAHNAKQAISIHAKRKADDLVSELNETVPIAKAVHLDQAGIYELITSESEPQKIRLSIGLKDWGVITSPFLSYYGRVHVNEIEQWWQEHGNSLFRHNLRLFYRSSDVNDALKRTLATNAESFWYFNNGVTVICDAINKGAAGAPHRRIGLFTCEGSSIVNGAQTVGTIGSVGGIATGASDETDFQDAWVQVRIISLEKCPPEFGRAITRAANLQNAVGNREFAAMDPLQHRLATEFALDRRKYIYKQGETDPRGEQGSSIVEATQALACAKSIDLAVQVKREISALWADTQRPPYTDIFNDSLTSTHLWRSVLVMRAVDREIQEARSSSAPRADMVGVHLNRVILHLVFQDPGVRALRYDGADEDKLIEAAREAAKRVFPRVAGYIQKAHDGEYLASLCKNLRKCQDLVAAVSATPTPDAQHKLFE